MQLMRRLALTVGILVPGLLAGNARAAVITTYTNLATWQAAAGATQVETFSSASVGDFALPTASSYGPVNFLGFSISGNPNGDHIGVHTGVVSGGSDTPIPASFLGQNFVS